MNGRIARIFHSFTGKKKIADGSEPEITGAGRFGVPEAVKTVDRKEFERIVNEGMKSVDCRGCLLVSDVDRYKKLGSIYGRDAADDVLTRVRELMLDLLLSEDSAVVGGAGISGSRPGGDVSAAGCSDRDTCMLWLPFAERDAASKLRRRVGIINDRLLHPQGGIPPATVSVGAAFCQAGDDCRGLMKRAYKALCTVKESGRCGCEFL